MAGTPMVGWLRCSTRLALLGRYAICINYLHTRTAHNPNRFSSYC